MRQRGERQPKLKSFGKAIWKATAVEACGHNKRIQMELPHHMGDTALSRRENLQGKENYTIVKSLYFVILLYFLLCFLSDIQPRLHFLSSLVASG